MNTTRTGLTALLATAGLAACQPSGTSEAWLGQIERLEDPAGAGSRYPHLAATGDGRIVMSWLQAQASGGFALQHATWDQGGWGAAGTVTSGTDWFVNWADFPSVVPVTPTTWVAHWLQQRPGSVYSYDVRVSASRDAGATWSAPSSPHDDGTPTEHGFVTMYGADGAAHAVWLDGRNTAGGHDHGGGTGAMTLRGATPHRSACLAPGAHAGRHGAGGGARPDRGAGRRGHHPAG